MRAVSGRTPQLAGSLNHSITDRQGVVREVTTRVAARAAALQSRAPGLFPAHAPAEATAASRNGLLSPSELIARSRPKVTSSETGEASGARTAGAPAGEQAETGAAPQAAVNGWNLGLLEEHKSRGYFEPALDPRRRGGY